ncbi:hypothetical protein VTH06DRAFT_7489 [Thermothelomyces fergusii]
MPPSPRRYPAANGKTSSVQCPKKIKPKPNTQNRGTFVRNTEVAWGVISRADEDGHSGGDWLVKELMGTTREENASTTAQNTDETGSKQRRDKEGTY